jgi:hypothetical protein
MRIRAKYLLAGLGVAILSLPALAHTESTGMNLTETTTIGSTQLNPGDYEFKLKDGASKVEVEQNGHVVAEVPCQRIQLSRKSLNSQVVITENKITEIDFSGKTEALQFP